MSTVWVDHVEPGWEPVRDALVEGLLSGEDRGAGVAVMHRGHIVAEVIGGWRDKQQTLPYNGDTLQLVFSTTKGIASTAIAICVERGLLKYDEKVSAYWPEFAAKGKGDVTVAQLLSHRAGLFTIERDITLEECLNWDTVTHALADTTPLFPVDTAHGYHALTFGWLAGELVRRVSGKNIGRFVQEEIAGPLGVEMYIGLPEEHEHRVAHLMAHPLPTFTPEETKLMMERSGIGTNGWKALSIKGAFGNGVFNLPEVHRAEIPGANGISNVRALATIYSATFREVNGVRLFGDATRELATRNNTPSGEEDVVLLSNTEFAMGYMVHSPRTPFGGPSSYGHNGAGGSTAFACPAMDLSMSYAMNTMLTTVNDADPRCARVTAAAMKCAANA
jgi:CubicO group peptidase (beta-lactamase class C family)